jgi:membrane-bound serine protease (ClpP class)
MLLVCGLGGAISCSWFSFKYLSKTKEGRKALLMDSEIKLPEDRHKGLVNKKGTALTDLRPGGVLDLEGERVEASTEGEYLVKGTKVIVFKIEADFVYVKEYTEEKEEA